MFYRGSEDFGNFTKVVPGAMFFISNGEDGECDGCHTLHFDFNDEFPHRFEYRLEGRSSLMRSPVVGNKVTLSALQPGRYRLSVARAGNLSNATELLSFRIRACPSYPRPVYSTANLHHHSAFAISNQDENSPPCFCHFFPVYSP